LVKLWLQGVRRQQHTHATYAHESSSSNSTSTQVEHTLVTRSFTDWHVLNCIDKPHRLSMGPGPGYSSELQDNHTSDSHKLHKPSPVSAIPLTKAYTTPHPRLSTASLANCCFDAHRRHNRNLIAAYRAGTRSGLFCVRCFLVAYFARHFAARFVAFRSGRRG
jgi:hypothetical protein